MEQFREHEKEFKTKEFSIKGLQRGQKTNDDNPNEFSDYESDNQETGYLEDNSEETSWLKEIDEKLDLHQKKLEQEMEITKGKKHKGATSFKQKEKKEKELNFKLTQAKKFREKIADLGVKIEYIETEQFEVLKPLIVKYVEKPEEDQAKT